MKFNQLKQILVETGQILLSKPFDNQVKTSQITALYNNFKNLSEEELQRFAELIKDQVFKINVEEGIIDTGIREEGGINEDIISIPLVNLLIASFAARDPTQDDETEGRIKALRILIDPDAQKKINEKLHRNGSNVLQLAVESNSLEIVRFLVEEKSADPTNILDYAFDYAKSFFVNPDFLDLEKDEKGQKSQLAILQYLIDHSDFETIKELLKDEIVPFYLENKTPINKEILSKSSNSKFWFMIACCQGDLEAIEALNVAYNDILQYDPKEDNRKLHVNSKLYSNKGLLALHYATEEGHVEAIKILIEKGKFDLEIDAQHNHYNDNPTLMLIHCAARSGNPEVVRLILELGMKIDAIDKNGKTLLHYAAKYGRLEVIKYLLEKGAIEATDQDRKTPLHYATEEGHVEAIKILIENDKISLELYAQYNHNNDSPTLMLIHCAARSGNPEVVRLILELGMNINTKDKDGKTAFHYAAKYGRLEVIKYLLEKGADVNAKDKEDKTALHYAAESGHVEAVAMLIKLGAKVDDASRKDRTALHIATESGHIKAVTKLIELGANYNRVDKMRRTVLHIAVESGHIDLVDKYITLAVDRNYRDSNNRTALELAIDTGNIEIFEKLFLADKAFWLNSGETAIFEEVIKAGKVEFINKLIELGVNPNLKSWNNKPILHYAAQIGHVNVVSELIKLGAKVGNLDSRGRTAMHIAASSSHVKKIQQFGTKTKMERKSTQKNHIEVVKKLIELGADVNAKDKDGKSPLYSAIEEYPKESFKMVQALLLAGADPNSDIPPGVDISENILNIIKEFKEDRVNAIVKRTNMTHYYPNLFKDRDFVEALINHIELHDQLSDEAKYNYLQRAYNEYQQGPAPLDSMINKLEAQLASIKGEMAPCSELSTSFKPGPTPSFARNGKNHLKK